MTIGPERQLTEGRRPVGLLSEPQELRLRRLVHEMWIDLEEIRRNKTPEALVRVMQATQELLRLGYLPVIISRGSVVGASHQKLKDQTWDREEVAKSLSNISTRESSLDQWLLYQSLIREVELLDEATRTRLIRELRISRKAQNQNQNQK